MLEICIYLDKTPLDNLVCNQCNLFLNTCIPVVISEDGYAGGECDSFLCEGCSRNECFNKTLTNI